MKSLKLVHSRVNTDRIPLSDVDVNIPTGNMPKDRNEWLENAHFQSTASQNHELELLQTNIPIK